MRLKNYGRSISIGALAGTIYGLWAIYANWSHDLVHVVRAASAQFLLSFCSTSFLTLMIEVVLTRGRSAPNLAFAAIGPHAGMVTLFVVVHWCSGTPNILTTIAPSASIGLVFSIVYVLKRTQAPRASDRDAPGRPGGLPPDPPRPRARSRRSVPPAAAPLP